MARVRNIVLLFASVCCYASISSADRDEYEGTQEITHEQLVNYVRNIAEEVRDLQIELQDNDADIVKSLSKRQAVNPANGLPMNVPVKMSGFAFGKRDGQLVRRSANAGSKPVKLAGFAFGKRGQLVKRSSDDQLEEEETEKRAAMDAFAFGKRGAHDLSGLSALSFGKRRDPMGFSGLTFGKRGMGPSGLSAFNFGKRRGDPLSAFDFGKRGMNRDSLSAFDFGKRGRALSAFDFGKRGMEMPNFLTFGKREDLEEDGAFEDENGDKKRGYNGMSGLTFGKRDTKAAADNSLDQNEETLRTD